MAEDDPFDNDNPFGGLPFLGDLGKLFQNQGPINWDAARQFAQQLSTGGQPEPNVDPVERVNLTELARVAELHVARHTGLDPTSSGAPVQIEPVTRSTWAATTLDSHRELMERLAERLRAAPPAEDEFAGPEAQLLGGLFQFINPMMMAMSAGSMAGHLSTTSLGPYDLPIPREGDTIQIVPQNLDDFAEEWSIPIDDVRLWVCVHNLTMHSVFSVPHVRAAVLDLLHRYIDGFRHDPHALESKMSGLELSGDPMDLQSQMQQMFGDPEVLLGAMRSEQQGIVVPDLEALLSVIVGYTDHTIEAVGRGLIGSYDSLVEAFRRRRVTAADSDKFVERLLGVDVRPDLVERGHAFVSGVLERAGEEGLARLWEAPRTLPTPNEVDAAGLWLARIELPEES